jgi:hypothetical protein
MRRRLRWTLTLAVQAGTRHLASSPLAAAAGGHGGEHDVSPSQRLVLMVSSVGLVVTAGLMSGLTLGLMSMDVVELEVLKRSGTPREQTYAATITPILANQHFLLVTLLLCNAVSMEALPLFLDRLADPVTAILISVTAVLVFGEILPQAVCSRCAWGACRWAGGEQCAVVCSGGRAACVEWGCSGSCVAVAGACLQVPLVGGALPSLHTPTPTPHPPQVWPGHWLLLCLASTPAHGRHVAHQLAHRQAARRPAGRRAPRALQVR